MQNFYRTKKAAEILGLSHRTLERWRFEGQGPVFRKFGKLVVYAETDLTQWSDGQIRTSTSDVGECY